VPLISRPPPLGNVQFARVNEQGVGGKLTTLKFWWNAGEASDMVPAAELISRTFA
jgi:hypothetical protein